VTDFNLDELLALQEVGYWIEIHVSWFVVLLYAWAAWRFHRSPDRAPHPQRYRRVPAAVVVAFALHAALVVGRAVMLERPPILTVFEARSFLGLLVVFVALVGCRRLGEAPVAGLLASGAAAGLVASALLTATPSACPLAVTLRNPWFQGHRTLLLIGYALTFVGLAVRLSMRLRPPQEDRVAMRGLIASGDILTDHPHRSTWLYRAGVPFLLLSLVTRLHWNGLTSGLTLDWHPDAMLNLALLVFVVLHQHAQQATIDPFVVQSERTAGGCIARAFLTRRGSTFFLAVALLLAVASVVMPEFTVGLQAAAAAVLLTLVPCLLRATRLRFVDRPKPPTFEELMDPPNVAPPTTLDVQNPQLAKADLDDAFNIIGFRSYRYDDPGSDDGAFLFGTPTTVYGYFTHLFLVPVLLILPFCATTCRHHVFVAQAGQRLDLDRPLAERLGGATVTVQQTVATFAEAPGLDYPSTVLDRLATALFLSSKPLKVTIDTTRPTLRGSITMVQLGEERTPHVLSDGRPLDFGGIRIVQGAPTWDVTLFGTTNDGRRQRVTVRAGDRLPEGLPGAGLVLAPVVRTGLVTSYAGRSKQVDAPSATLLAADDGEPTILPMGTAARLIDGTLLLEDVRPLTRLIVVANPYVRILELLLLVAGVLWLVRVLLPWYIVVYRLTPQRESVVVTMRIYAGGLVSSPSKLVQQLTGNLVMEHESMF